MGSFYSRKWIAWETAAYKASESITSQKKTGSIWFSNYLLDIVGWLLFKPHLNTNRVQIIQGKLNRFLQTSARSSHVFYKKRYSFKFRKIYEKTSVLEFLFNKGETLTQVFSCEIYTWKWKLISLHQVIANRMPFGRLLEFLKNTSSKVSWRFQYAKQKY